MAAELPFPVNLNLTVNINDLPCLACLGGEADKTALVNEQGEPVTDMPVGVRLIIDDDSKLLIPRSKLRSVFTSAGIKGENRHTLHEYHQAGVEQLRAVMGCTSDEVERPVRVFHVMTGGTDLCIHERYENGRSLRTQHVCDVAKEFLELESKGVTHTLCDLVDSIAKREFCAESVEGCKMTAEELEVIACKLEALPTELCETAVLGDQQPISLTERGRLVELAGLIDSLKGEVPPQPDVA